MSEVLQVVTIIMNLIHDLIVQVVVMLGFPVNDKMIHFYFMGVIGLVLFVMIDIVFKSLVKYGISVLSFIYAFSIIVVVSFVIEIQQKITGAGNMEFADIVYGLGGFLLFLVGYLILLLVVRSIYKKITR